MGHFALGTGLTADGCVLVNALAFRQFVPVRGPDEVSFGLVRLTKGAKAEQVAAALRKRLGCVQPAGQRGDVDVLTRSDAIRYELRRWIRETSIGMIFQLGVVVSLVVGTVIVYQVLSSDVAAHLRQYATLKAMGYTNGFLSRRGAGQAVGLALLGFVPGLLLAEALYRTDLAPGEHSHRNERRPDRRRTGHDRYDVCAVGAGGPAQVVVGRSRGAVLS